MKLLFPDMMVDSLLNQRQDSVVDYDNNAVILLAAVTAFIGQWTISLLKGTYIDTTCPEQYS